MDDIRKKVLNGKCTTQGCEFQDVLVQVHAQATSTTTYQWPGLTCAGCDVEITLNVDG